MLEPIDLRFLGLPHAIGVYVVETSDGPALHDCGPATTLPRLNEALLERGLALGDIRHLLLSHIHFDHAGAAGSIVREHPEIRVWVSEVGAPHLVDPARLEASARRLYGAQFDRLWGELVPIPEANVSIARGNVLGWDVFPAPGHASHHVCYLRDGTLLAGDSCGLRLQPSEYVLPIAPPPDIDVEAWHATIGEIAHRAPERLALIHFGVATDVPGHLRRLGDELDRWAELVRRGLDTDEFRAEVRPAAGRDGEIYDAVAPYDQSWQGLRRYWLKRGELPADPAPGRPSGRRHPGELVHVDIKQLARISAHGDGHRITGASTSQVKQRIDGRSRLTTGYEYLHVMIDDHSRLAYAEVLGGLTASHAAAFLHRAVAWFADRGVTVQAVMSDNGSAYISKLYANALGELALRHLRIRPRRPRTNGKAERLIQTLLNEWAYARIYGSSPERTSALTSYLERYNFQRPHGSLGHQPPASRLNNLVRNYS